MTTTEIVHAMRPHPVVEREHVVRLRGVSRQAVQTLPFSENFVVSRESVGTMTVDVPGWLQGRFADDLAKAWPDMLALDPSAEIVKP